MSSWGIVILFLILVVLNVPVVYCMLIPSILFLAANDIGFSIVAQRMFTGVNSFPLLAVSLFILAGNIMNRGGVTDRLFDFIGKLVGHRRGGLAYANVLASVVFAGMSGSAMADAGGLGQIELRAMKEDKYPESFSLAVTGASSIIGPIIPPSVPAILLACATGISVGRLFVGGFVPGLVIALVFCIQIHFMCKKMGRERKAMASWKEIGKSFGRAFFSLMTPIIILAGCFSGKFTPTETSSVAATYALILGFAYGNIKPKDIPEILAETARTIASVLVLVSVATLFSYVLARANIPQMVTEGFTGLVTNKWVAILLIHFIFLVVGMLMDNGPAILVFVPILLPIASFYGFDPVFFGIIVIINLMIGTITPPVGMVLYVLSGVSSVPFINIAKATIPFIISCILVMLLLTFMPGVVTALPTLVYG